MKSILKKIISQLKSSFRSKLSMIKPKPKVLEHLEAIAPTIPINIYWLDINNVVIGGNELALHAVGGKAFEDLIGKSLYEFYPKEIADRIALHNEEVIRTGKALGQEESIRDITTGKIRYFSAFKSPIYHDDGSILGTVCTSIEITAEKEAARLALENEIQRIELEGKERLITVARTVAHDIASPVTSLKIMVDSCKELDPEKRAILSNSARRILDISNNLFSTYRLKANFLPDSQFIINKEPQEAVFLFDLITQLVSERRVEYSSRSLTLETIIDDNAHFAFALMQSSQLSRTLSNLINNAADATSLVPEGLVSVQLGADNNHVTITVRDNGEGMPQAMVDKLLQRHFFTSGKENGHGLGWQQVWDTIDQNEGSIAIRSTENVGTSIEMTFPRATAPQWIAQALHISHTDIVVILDDDESILGAMSLRLTSYLTRNPALRIHHFTQGNAVLKLLNGFTPEEKKSVLLLIDYDLFGQEKNGIDIIEASQIQRTMLITGYYTRAEVQQRIQAMSVKVLPKQLVAAIPVHMND